MSVKRTSFKDLIRQLFRFGVCGVIAFAIDYSLLYVLTEFAGINYLISAAISFSVSVVVNYIISVKWVFNVAGERSKGKDLVVFVILSLIGLGINQIVMWISVEKFAIWYMIGKLIATFVVMIWNYITRKLFLENDKTAKKAS
jgi:putative flippase GtrA